MNTPNKAVIAEAKSDDQEKAAVFLDAALHDIAGLRRSSTVKLLDFGCGRGGIASILRRYGYNAFGCDIAPLWKDEKTVNQEHFSVISREPYHVPHRDNTFDAVFSTTVMEHAQNKKQIFHELHRVLKPGGYSMHLFPGKWYLPYEPHIRIPLANLFWPKCPIWWLNLWAFLGVRNKRQIGLSRNEVVTMNLEFLSTNLSYWPTRRYKKLSINTFGNYFSPMEFYIQHGYGGVAQLLRKFPFRRITGLLAGELRMKFMVQRKELDSDER